MRSLAIATVVVGMGCGKESSTSSGSSATRSDAALPNRYLQVDGSVIDDADYRIAYSMLTGSSSQRTTAALDLLLRRELFARRAGTQTATLDQVDEALKNGTMYFGGDTISIASMTHDPPIDCDPVDPSCRGFFNIQRTKAWVGSLNVSLAQYRESQRHELLGKLGADAVAKTAAVTLDDARKHYLAQTTVTYDVVVFSPTPYRDAMKPTKADLDRFAATHADEIKAAPSPEMVAREVWGREAAKRAALDAIANAKGKKLAELYEREPPLDPSKIDLDAIAAGVASTKPPAKSIAPMPSGDRLPAFGPVPPPRVRSFGPVPRDEVAIAVIGAEASLLFDELAVGAIADRPYETVDGYAIVQLVARGTPDLAAFDKAAEAIRASLERERRAEVLSSFLRSECAALQKAGKITLGSGMKDIDAATSYEPCKAFR